MLHRANELAACAQKEGFSLGALCVFHEVRLALFRDWRGSVRVGPRAACPGPPHIAIGEALALLPYSPRTTCSLADGTFPDQPFVSRVLWIVSDPRCARTIRATCVALALDSFCGACARRREP
jgi:hypothetical protein